MFDKGAKYTHTCYTSMAGDQKRKKKTNPSAEKTKQTLLHGQQSQEAADSRARNTFKKHNIKHYAHASTHRLSQATVSA